MKTTQRFAVSEAVAAVLFGLGGCTGMSAQDRDTAIGAGVGAEDIKSTSEASVPT